jgi:hypothetical protein
MDTMIRLKDEGFKKECRESISMMVQKGFDIANKKICQTYRKSLGDCKLWVNQWQADILLANSFLFAAKFFHLEDYKKEVERLEGEQVEDPGDKVVLPTRERLMELFLEEKPDYSDQDVRDVSFFYHVALCTVEKSIKNKTSMVDNDVWAVLSKARRWASSMAFAMVLVEKISVLDNTKHNYKRTMLDRDNLDPENPASRMKREKMISKATLGGIVEVQINNFFVFKALRMEKDAAKRRATRRKFRNWETKVGIRHVLGKTAAQKRPSVQPLGLSNKRQTVEKSPPRKSLLVLDLCEDGIEQDDDDASCFEVGEAAEV